MKNSIKTVATIETISRCFYIDYDEEKNMFYVAQDEIHRTCKPNIKEALAVVLEKYIKNPAVIKKIYCDFENNN